MNKNSKLYKIIFGNTKTKQVSGAAIDIVFDSVLSSKLYDNIDKQNNFAIENNGKKYVIKHLK